MNKVKKNALTINMSEVYFAKCVIKSKTKKK